MTKHYISAFIIFAIVIAVSRIVPTEYEGIFVIIAFVIFAWPILWVIASWIKQFYKWIFKK